MFIRKATRQKKKLRIAADGPSGAGKTYSLLRCATAMLVRGMCSKILVIDTENDSASLYAGENPDGTPFEFDTLPLTKFGPTDYVAAIHMGEREGYDCIVIDSLSHAWVGEGGALDLADKKAASKGGNKFAAWADITPMHRKMVDAIIQSRAHVLATMRTKTEWTTETDPRTGKSKPVRLGTASVQREGLEYEFDVYARLDLSHQIHIEKTRCSALDGAMTLKPGPAFWQPLWDWMDGAAPAASPTPAAVVTVASGPPSARAAAASDPVVPSEYAHASPDTLARVKAERYRWLAAKAIPDNDQHKVTQAWGELLSRWGVKSAREMTEAQAAGLLDAMRPEIDAYEAVWNPPAASPAATDGGESATAPSAAEPAAGGVGN